MYGNNLNKEKNVPVVIVGGSLAGLLCGVALKHAGHKVRILEQYGSNRQSQATGLGLGLSAQKFLKIHDPHSSSLSHTVSQLLIMDNDYTTRHLATGSRAVTSWDAVFYRLRAIFDGHSSPHCAGTPHSSEADGTVTYEVNKRVLEARRSIDSDSAITLTVEDSNSRQLEYIQTDLVIGADGPNSMIRGLYQPDVQRDYAGYIMWRGLVPENEVSSETRELFENSVIAHKASDNSSCVMYMIPGINGSLNPGERLLNFIWYINARREELDEVLIDAIDGHTHRNFVPPGRVRNDIKTSRLREAKLLPLPRPFLEVMTEIKEPSIQVISDYCSPRAAFEDGHILLVGDALSHFRPHAALGVNQAAFHAAAVEEYVQGSLSWQQWERKVTGHSYLHWSMNVWWGAFYQKSLMAALPAALRYWSYWCWSNLASWWT